jgi:hypothetical protein
VESSGRPVDPGWGAIRIVGQRTTCQDRGTRVLGRIVHSPSLWRYDGSQPPIAEYTLSKVKQS